MRLVRLRNPHGNDEEWQGKWSDGDRRWDSISEEDKRRFNITKKNDGEFYMAFDDFLAHFGEVEVVHVRPGRVKGEKWEVFGFSSKWKGPSAGGCGNDSIGQVMLTQDLSQLEFVWYHPN